MHKCFDGHGISCYLSKPTQATSTRLRLAPQCPPSSPSPPVTSPSLSTSAPPTQSFSPSHSAQARWEAIWVACDSDTFFVAANLTPKICATTPSITTSPVCSGLSLCTASFTLSAPYYGILKEPRIFQKKLQTGQISFKMHLPRCR